MTERPSTLPPAAPAPEDMLSDSVLSGGWHLGSVVGSGGMARVYLATHPDGHRAAIKLLHAQLAVDERACQRLLREAQIAGLVEHPAIPKVEGVGQTASGVPFIVMELLEGLTLEAEWRRNGHRLSLARSLRIVEQLLQGLSACHQKQVIHRDLKPSNVFLTGSGALKILDFGVASAPDFADDIAQTGVAFGTPSYMAPEQAMGAWDQVDARADVFSVGAILFTLLSSKRLHRARTQPEAFTLAATRPAPSLAQQAPDVPASVVALVDKALCWDKWARFANAPEMLEALTPLLAEHVSPPKPQVSVSTPPRPDKVLEALDKAEHLKGKAPAAPKPATLLAQVSDFYELLQWGPAPAAAPSPTKFLDLLGRYIEQQAAHGPNGLLQELPQEVPLEVLECVVGHLPSDWEPALAEALPRLSPLGAYQTLRTVLARDWELGQRLLRVAALSAAFPLDFSAQLILHGWQESGREQLEQLLESELVTERCLGYRVLADFGVRAERSLTKLVRAEDFHERLALERTLLLEAVFASEPQTAEQLAIQLVRGHQVLSSRELIVSRKIGAVLLGQHCSSAQVEEALRFAASRVWWNPPLVRVAAEHALVSVKIRRERGKRDAEPASEPVP